MLYYAISHLSDYISLLKSNTPNLFTVMWFGICLKCICFMLLPDAQQIAIDLTIGIVFLSCISIVWTGLNMSEIELKIMWGVVFIYRSSDFRNIINE